MREKQTRPRRNILNPRIIELPKLHDGRGNLTVVENGIIPFAIKRVYYIYDVPFGIERANHAHKKLERFIIAFSGSFDVILEDRNGEGGTWSLSGCHYGLYIPPMIWSTVTNFSSGAVCLVLASDNYDESDYIRDRSMYANLESL